MNFNEKFILFVVIIVSIVSCKKDGIIATPNPAPAKKLGELIATGELIYSCICVDGSGLIFGTDDHKTFVFDNYDTLVVNSIMTRYNNFLNVHSQLIYTNIGETRCTGNVNPGIMDSIVKIVSLTKL